MHAHFPSGLSRQMANQLKGRKTGRFPVITICGSTRFKDDIVRATGVLTHAGWIVLPVGCIDLKAEEKLPECEKEMLNAMHQEKIRMSEAIFVVNRDLYVGKSTRSEIDFAIAEGKQVYYMFHPEESEEVK